MEEFQEQCPLQSLLDTETMVNIEIFGFLRLSENHDGSYPDILSNPVAAKHRILQ